MLNYGNPLAQPDATLTMTKAMLDSIQLKEMTLDQASASGPPKIQGNRSSFTEFMALLDTFPFWFNIVTPNLEDLSATS